MQTKNTDKNNNIYKLPCIFLVSFSKLKQCTKYRDDSRIFDDFLSSVISAERQTIDKLTNTFFTWEQNKVR